MGKKVRRAIRPGEVLREDVLAELEITPHALAVALRVPVSRINDIVLERRAMSADTALRLSRYLDTTPQYWMNLQSDHDLNRAVKESATRIRQDVRPRKAA